MIERIPYKGWENCYKLTNGRVELIVTTDVGPRIIHFGFPDGENEFLAYEEWLGKTGSDEWRNYGGHRLWHAPEVRGRTNTPDNEPVIVEEYDEFVRFIQPLETNTGIQKEIDIALDPTGPHVEIVHRLRNANLWTVELAPWAISVMAPGGVAILPLPPRGPHSENLQPTSALALWAYTDMSDPRWTWGREHILVRQDPTATTPQKIGATGAEEWLAYARNGHLMVTRFTYLPGILYPDLGTAIEVFTNGKMLEIETLGPLTLLEPGDIAEHTETWSLYQDVPQPQTEADVIEHILPRVRETTIRG